MYVFMYACLYLRRMSVIVCVYASLHCIHRRSLMHSSAQSVDSVSRHCTCCQLRLLLLHHSVTVREDQSGPVEEDGKHIIWGVPLSYCPKESRTRESQKQSTNGKRVILVEITFTDSARKSSGQQGWKKFGRMRVWGLIEVREKLHN